MTADTLVQSKRSPNGIRVGVRPAATPWDSPGSNNAGIVGDCFTVYIATIADRIETGVTLDKFKSTSGVSND
ncbi:unnamed protein product, partial [Brenthis ino]